MWYWFDCVSCRLIGAGCRAGWQPPCAGGQLLVLEVFAWEPWKMIVSIVVGVSVAIFLIAYLQAFVLKTVFRK